MSNGRYANKKSIVQPTLVHVCEVLSHAMLNSQGPWCVVLLVAFVTLVTADEDMKMGDSDVKIAAQSGMMEFMHSRQEYAHRPVHIRMSRVVQIDEDGNEVMDCTAPAEPNKTPIEARRKRASVGELEPAKEEGGKQPIAAHAKGKRFSNFGRTNFTVGPKKERMNMKNAGTLRALMVRIHADLGSDVGKMAIDVALPEEDGEVDIGGEKQKLKRGDMKFDIEMTDWSWCKEEGEQGAAAFLDVYINVNGSRAPTLSNRRSASAPASFDLGDNTTIGFSGKFQRDGGIWSDMVEGYPKIDTNDSSLIVVRFPRFNTSLLYDPILSVMVSGATSYSLSAIFATMTLALTYTLLR